VSPDQPNGYPAVAGRIIDPGSRKPYDRRLGGNVATNGNFPLPVVAHSADAPAISKNEPDACRSEKTRWLENLHSQSAPTFIGTAEKSLKSRSEAVATEASPLFLAARDVRLHGWV
jgi:hypothetical protein